MVKARIRELSPYVNFFLIVEADFTFSGKARSLISPSLLPELRELALLFNPETQPKVETFLLTSESSACRSLEEGSPDAWAREAFCRDAPRVALLELFGISGSDTIMISDCDEIPDFPRIKDFISGLPSTGPSCLLMDFYYYNFTCRKKQPWWGTIVLSGVHLSQNWEELRQRRSSLPLIPSGWHLSYFMSSDEIIYKIKSFSHQEFNREEYCNPGKIIKNVRERKDLFTRGEHENMPFSDPLKSHLPRTFFYFPSYMKSSIYL